MNRARKLIAGQRSTPPDVASSEELPTKSTWGWDVLNLVAVAAVTIALHWQYLNVQIFDVDEGEFMASAAYAHATLQSAFSYVTLPYTIAAYKLSTDLFGPYEMLPLRIGTLMMVIAVTGLVYAWAARETSRWCGLLVASVLSVYSMYFNGFMANREWPCVLALVAGAYLFVRSLTTPRRPSAATIVCIGPGDRVVSVLQGTSGLCHSGDPIVAHLTSCLPPPFAAVAWKGANIRRGRFDRRCDVCDSFLVECDTAGAPAR